MRVAPSGNVLAWLDDHGAAGLFLSTVTVAEIRYGLNCLPTGKRRQDLESRFLRFVANGFAYRILSFDEACAGTYAEIMSARKNQGQPMSVLDGQIAAIASANGHALATRNLKDFQSCGVELIDPFAYGGAGEFVPSP